MANSDPTAFKAMLEVVKAYGLNIILKHYISIS